MSLELKQSPYSSKSRPFVVDIDLKTIRELLSVVGTTDITELTIESGDQRITVKKAPTGTAFIQQGGEAQPAALVAVARPASTMSFEPKLPAAESAPPAPAPAVDNGSSNGHVQITSPMVGTFYRAASPTAKPFVNIGDRITVGQTVCIIEAMKLMNDMPSEVAGKIVKVLVENGTTVEYGQALFLVDPKG
jgi:acetyl-CoA carboxylase biotin carboxyl carrier protein